MTVKRKKKLSKRLKERCKKLGIRITVKKQGKRVYKTTKALLQECKKKLKRKKKRKVKKMRRRKFGTGRQRRPRLTPRQAAVQRAQQTVVDGRARRLTELQRTRRERDARAQQRSRTRRRVARAIAVRAYLPPNIIPLDATIHQIRNAEAAATAAAQAAAEAQIQKDQLGNFYNDFYKKKINNTDNDLDKNQQSQIIVGNWATINNVMNNNGNSQIDFISQGMKAIDIIHDVKNNFQRGVNAVRSFLRNEPNNNNNNNFNMRDFINNFTTFAPVDSHKKVIGAYLKDYRRVDENGVQFQQQIDNTTQGGANGVPKINIRLDNKQQGHTINENHLEHYMDNRHNNVETCVTIDGVIEDKLGKMIFLNTCSFCRNNDIINNTIDPNEINNFKAMNTIFFLKHYYADYVNDTRLINGGLPNVGDDNRLGKWTKNFLHICQTNQGNIPNITDANIQNNTDNIDSYTTAGIHHQNHVLVRDWIIDRYDDFKTGNFNNQNARNALVTFYNVIYTADFNDFNANARKQADIFNKCEIILNNNANPNDRNQAIIKLHKKHHISSGQGLNIFNIIDASSKGNYAYNLVNDCFNWGTINNHMGMSYARSVEVYPRFQVQPYNNNNGYHCTITINDGHFLYSMIKIGGNVQQQFILKLYLKIVEPQYNNNEKLTAVEYKLPYRTNEDYESINRFVTIKHSSIYGFENGVRNYIQHLVNAGEINVGQPGQQPNDHRTRPYRIINGYNAFFVQIYPDCHTGGQPNPNENQRRNWQIENRCLVKLKETLAAIVYYQDNTNEHNWHYMILYSKVPDNPITKEFIRLFELCQPKRYDQNNPDQLITIPIDYTEKMLLSIMNYKRITDSLQYYGLKQHLEANPNLRGLLATKDQSAFLQYFHIQRFLNNNNNNNLADNRISILLDMQKKNYTMTSNFGEVKKINKLKKLSEEFEEITNFPLVEYEFYVDTDNQDYVVKARQRINSLVLMIEDNQEAIEIVRKIFKETGDTFTNEEIIQMINEQKRILRLIRMDVGMCTDLS